MPITSNIAWDRRLEAFKGRDAAQYIETVLAGVSRCAACRLPLCPGAALSLSVDVTEGRDPEGRVVSLTFDPAVCHLQCQKPRLRVRQSAAFIGDLASVGARLVLDGSGRTNTAVLAYTFVPSLVFGAPGGEMTSALVAALLEHGFQISFTANYREILQHAAPARDTCTCTMEGSGEIRLHVDGMLMHSQQLDTTDADDAAWLEAASTGHVLVISGDNLTFTDTGLELSAAARLGTLVTGIVPALV